MHEIKKINGVLKVRKNKQTWTTPYVVGEDFFSSEMEACEALGVTRGAVSGAICNGHRLKGLKIRRAKEDEIRSNLQVNETVFTYKVREDGLVEVKSANNTWSRRVFHQGKIWTIPDCARHASISKTAMYEYMANGGDSEYVPAREEHMPPGSIKFDETVVKKRSPQKKKSPKKPAEQTIFQLSTAMEEKLPFVGVRWPNGSVDVRFPDGRQFMTRDSEKELPPEVRSLTRWL